MVKSLSYAAEKWERKTSNAGAIWKDMVTGAGAAYCENFQAFVGHPTPQACAAYTAGVGATTAADFQSAISGKRGKYEAKLRAVR